MSNSTNNRDRTGLIRSLVTGALLATLLASSPVVAADSDQLDLSNYHGKIVLLDFWASWCVPCRRSFPWMNAMQRKYGDAGLVVIAVNVDNDLADAKKFLQKYPAEFTVSYDDGRKLVKEYAVEAMPSSFLIDRNGAFIENHLGFKVANTEEYEAAIVAALRK